MLGSGVTQLISLITEIVSESSKNTFLIEEPETHFHASLQRLFLRFLQEETGCSYLINSHSNAFIQSAFNSEETSLFKVSFKDKQVSPPCSRIERVKRLHEINELLGDLGAMPSDLMLANGIIWVEGPSDRHYLNKWLDLYCQHGGLYRPVEGRDYTIMFYGGSILSNLGAAEVFDDDFFNGFVGLLSINHNTVVVMDYDGGPSDGKKYANKTKIDGQLNEVGLKNSWAWVTDGKEIENYLPGKALRLLFERRFLITKYKTNSKKSFREYFTTNIYENNKNKQSQIIVGQLEVDDLVSNDVLYEKIERLHMSILGWGGLNH